MRPGGRYDRGESESEVTMPPSRSSGPVGGDASVEPSGDSSGIADALSVTPETPQALDLFLEGSQMRWDTLRRLTPRLTPAQFADLYHRLEVPYVDPGTGRIERARVDIHSYVCPNSEREGHMPNPEERGEVVSLLRRELGRPSADRRLLGLADGDRARVAHAFNGQGSPAEIELALCVALTFGRTTAGGLQTYCDSTAKIGLDCVGFVKNYLVFVGLLPSPLDTVSGIARRGRRLENFDDMACSDVLTWEGDGHIGLVNGHEAGTDVVEVVQCSGSRGLHVSPYHLRGGRTMPFTAMEHIDGRPRGNPVTLTAFRM
jgi:hypothetical protein